MNVIDLTDEHTPLYLLCLEDWSEEIKEAGTRKEAWCGRMKERGFRVKLALDDAGEVGGMIQYGPIEHSFVDGTGLYFIYCIWVHGNKEGRGNFQKKGMGKALIKAAEDDARDRGAQGMAAWGMLFPFWMKASWFRKQGYSKADRMGISVLLWKPFTDAAEPLRWIRQKKKPGTVSGKVTVTVFVNGWCQALNMVFERAKRAAAEFGDVVVFREIDTTDRAVFMEWGISDALFIDGKEVRIGPPPPYEKIYKLISKRVRKL
ncbi:MAG: GNAT family N-acetyltransferase [ANME-2 cluster archaeon]|nr:GNAT family N-acetyltransferase [ANME-2 cluster archaeon]MDF1531643.1 GNAT family N-acetyltransferase [ANME-2 cluster archaeon]